MCLQQFGDLLSSLQDMFFRHPQPTICNAIMQSVAVLAYTEHALQARAKTAVQAIVQQLKEEWAERFASWNGAEPVQIISQHLRLGLTVCGQERPESDDAEEAGRQACAERYCALVCVGLGDSFVLTDELNRLLRIHSEHDILTDSVRHCCSVI